MSVLQGVLRLQSDPSYNGLALLMDVTKQDDIDAVKVIIEEKVGNDGLWCLINNAGICRPGPVEWMTMEDMKR